MNNLLSPDVINGLFELGGAIVITKSCFLLLKEKLVRGCSILATSWFFSWSLYNLFYYPNLGQEWSFYAALLVVIAQLAYVSMMIYYRRKNG